MLTLHEPFSQMADFGSCTVVDRAVASEKELIRAVLDIGRQQRVFFKDTTDFHYPDVLCDREFLREVEHTFIIRHPREVIPSHFALNPDVTLPEIGFTRLKELYLAVRDVTGYEPVVVDSDLLLDQPEQTVQAYNERVGLTDQPDTLNWSAGERTEWSRTSRWHADASNSSGFERREREYVTTVDNDPVLAEFYEREMPCYEFLRERRMTTQ